ncbi:MAG: GTP-binding protein [Clostridia bacterium]|nr:GTP-binding protein [Clostridia bacterium]
MKIDIYSGFLGAGKTTLIKKMISEGYKNEKLMLIENEFGQIGIDGGFLKESGISITEMNSGCICCSLVGDFSEALKQAITTYNPDRIIIEPSGVGELSDVIKATESVLNENVWLNGLTTVADVNKCKMYMKNFGEFFNNQIEEAKCIVLSHTGNASEQKIGECVALLREKNEYATIITTDWDKLTGEQILSAIENSSSLEKELEEMKHEHHHHHHHHDEHCDCHEHGHHHHHHEHDEECDCLEHHHHHDHDEECDCHEHEYHHHHHDHDEHCDCGCHDHHHEHHHHHHADDVFDSWGVETAKKYSEDDIRAILNSFEGEELGAILRAKGIVDSVDGEWIYFDYIPGSIDIRRGNADVIGKLCVIGSGINKDKIRELFNV